jgi:hypothetical protein
VTDLSGSGISLDLPAGWGGEIRPPGLTRLGADEVKLPTVAHVANFPLPADRGDFGDGVVEIMQTEDVLMVLYEYDSSKAGDGLFRHEGTPGPLRRGDFDPAMLQRGVPGQSGLQLFFSDAGRAFCWYIVVGSHLDRSDVLPFINHVLGSLRIDS